MRSDLQQEKENHTSLEESCYFGAREIDSSIENLIPDLQRLKLSLVTEMLQFASSVEQSQLTEMQTAERMQKQSDDWHI